MSNKLPRADLITKVIPSSEIVTQASNQSEHVNRACCHRIKHFMYEYTKMQYHLRNIMRIKRTMDSAYLGKDDASKAKSYNYIEGITAIKGSDTEEWRGRVALWGIVPLWRASPPISTILVLRKPVPSDCWPFTGSRGEILLHLPYTQKVNGVSIEHIQPDTARSAPKNFTIHGILINDTEVKLMDAHYQNKRSAKQYFPLATHATFKSIQVRILSNQGNPKYTCVYRFHVYGDKI